MTRSAALAYSGLAHAGLLVAIIVGCLLTVDPVPEPPIVLRFVPGPPLAMIGRLSEPAPATPADTLGPLETQIKVASTRTRLVLMPLPDRTADEAVAIRGLLVTRDRPSWVDVGGQRALLRPATAEDLRGFPAEAKHADGETGTQRLYFEVASYPLTALGPNSIRIRSAAPSGAAAEAEVVILREARAAVGGTATVGGSR